MAAVKEILRAAGGSVAEKLLIPPGLIDIEPGFNIRIPGPDLDTHIEWLMGRIRVKGFDPTQPISVSRREDRFVVRNGHCRIMAVHRLVEAGEQIVTIPALLEPQGTNEVDRAYDIGNQNGGKPITDLEYGGLVKRQRNNGQTDAQILEGFGKSRVWLARVLDLAGAPLDVREAVARKEISATEAVKVVRRNGNAAGSVISKAVEHGGGRARPRDVEAVTIPRTEPVSVCSLAVAVVRAWRADATGRAFLAAMDALEARLGPLAR